jgi:hypothetical protein
MPSLPGTWILRVDIEDAANQLYSVETPVQVIVDAPSS